MSYADVGNAFKANATDDDATRMETQVSVVSTSIRIDNSVCAEHVQMLLLHAYSNPLLTRYALTCCVYTKHKHTKACINV